MAVKYQRNPASTIGAINNELQKIQVALEDAVSRTGTAPNQLEATLDANSQRIINLPEPTTNTEPVRKADFDTLGNRLIGEVNTAITDAEEATDNAISATNSANAAASNANTATDNANTAASNAYQAITDLESDGYAVINQIESDGQLALDALRVVNAGSFEDGATLTARNEVLYYLIEQTYYRWDGALPKTVPPSSTPSSTGGVGVGAWMDVGDAALRAELADPDKGARLVRGAVIYVNTLADLQSLDTSGIVVGQLAALSRGGAYYFNGSEWVSWGAGKFVHPLMDQSAIQDVLDSLENGESLTFLPGQYPGLVKNESLSGFPNNDQPCLLLRGKVGVKIYGSGAVLSTDTHAQGILELQECAFCYIEGLEVVGAGNFPELDGGTGRGEKGSSTAGYQTTGFWGYYKNNSRDTSEDDRGGFGGNFPQWGGGTASIWGVWNGGFIGNVSYGILIHNDCHHIKLNQCKASGFNYVGIGVGHNGDFHPTDLGYPESTNIVFEDCVGTGNYSAGAHAMHVDGFTLSRGEYSYSGHPNANMETDTQHNPGYGVTLRGSANFAKNVVITGGKYHNNVRKGIDSHASLGVNISENKVYDNGICGIYVAHTNTAQLAEESIITANRLRGNAFGNATGLLGSIYVGGNAAGQTIGDVIVSNNVILYGGGESISCRYLSHVMIAGNKIRGALQTSGNAHIQVQAEASEFEHDIQVTGNSVWDDTGFMPRGIQFSRIKDSLLSGNKVVMSGNVGMGIYTPGCQSVDVLNNSVRLGSTGRPVNVNQASGQMHGNIYEGGDQPSRVYTNSAAQRIPRISNSFSFKINFNGTASPDITNVTAIETVGSSSSIDQGVDVRFNGIPDVSRLSARFVVSSSSGLVAPGVTDDPFIYLRALSSSKIEIGLKATPSGTHLSAEEFTSGQLDVTVEIN